MSASIVAARTQVADDVDFSESLIISQQPSQTTSPQVTPTPIPPHTSSQASPSTSKDAKIFALQGKVSCLEAQVVGLQGQVDVLRANDFQREQVLQSQSKQIYEIQILVSQLIDAQGEMPVVVKDACHTETVQRNDDKDNDPNGLDELFDDLEDEMNNSEIDEGDIVELEITKDTTRLTYEGCDGLNVPFDFIQDDIIPEVTSDGKTDSMDSTKDVTKPDSSSDTAQTKITEEPMMYRDTGMTKEKWLELVKSWKKELTVSLSPHVSHP
ncbi:hypothetical protein L1987_43168 [Smallanthus sonchifolius]|uniref:Uncharacterized protein n=1 Tax=Smallanthus sonchifolius TaxID=185202 RepID=A0ACB9GM47_9ASTR|nr:hypothetical protein L1987_43168 [Smallanthus sonchifolius]